MTRCRSAAATAAATAAASTSLGAVQAIRGVSPAGLVFGPPVRSRKALGRSGAFQAMRPVPEVSCASTARWEGPTGASDGPTASGGRLANFSELPCSTLASKKPGLSSPFINPVGAPGLAWGPCYTGQHNKPAQDGTNAAAREVTSYL